MTIYTFLKECAELWPQKSLSLKQEEFYGAKLSQFSADEVAKLFNYLSENCKFFPKVADIFEAARKCGFTDKVKPYKPHVWEPTDCRLCGGSGQLAVFIEELINPAEGYRELHLRRVMQYQSSEPTTRTQPDWSRKYFRCLCPAGDVDTLEKGLPRWNAEKPAMIRRPI
jgi:hypothetical protein